MGKHTDLRTILDAALDAALNHYNGLAMSNDDQAITCALEDTDAERALKQQVFDDECADPRVQQDAIVRLGEVMRALSAAFVERETVVRSLACAFIAQEHVLLLGPPGTAKTELVRAAARAFLGADDFFAVLATKFSTMEDFFGPINVPAMKRGQYVRITRGRAWASRAVLVDEIFKGSSSILNCLLKLMQERKADNGGDVDVPLEVLVGASNEYPESDVLNALYDRFSYKHWVDYVADPATFERLLVAGGARCDEALEPGALDALRAAAAKVPFGSAEAARLRAVKAAVESEGFRPSDRTWVKCVKLLRASAVVDGRNLILPRDYRSLADVLWRRHEDRARLLATIGNSADPYGSKADAISDAIKTALRDIPDIGLLKSGKMRKTEIVGALAKVSQRISAELDKAREVHEMSGGDPSTEVALKAAEAALNQVDEINRVALFYREGK